MRRMDHELGRDDGRDGCAESEDGRWARRGRDAAARRGSSRLAPPRSRSERWHAKSSKSRWRSLSPRSLATGRRCERQPAPTLEGFVVEFYFHFDARPRSAFAFPWVVRRSRPVSIWGPLAGADARCCAARRRTPRRPSRAPAPPFRAAHPPAHSSEVAYTVLAWATVSSLALYATMPICSTIWGFHMTAHSSGYSTLM